jgi:transcriptional regulator with XRE-family HTH domain
MMDTRNDFWIRIHPNLINALVNEIIYLYREANPETTNHDIAEALGISTGSLSELRDNKRNCTIEDAFALAQLIEISPTSLMEILILCLPEDATVPDPNVSFETKQAMRVLIQKMQEELFQRMKQITELFDLRGVYPFSEIDDSDNGKPIM